MMNQAGRSSCDGAGILSIGAGREPIAGCPVPPLCHFPLVVLQQTSQSISTPHCFIVSSCFRPRRKQDPVVFALVIALLVRNRCGVDLFTPVDRLALRSVFDQRTLTPCDCQDCYSLPSDVGGQISSDTIGGPAARCCSANQDLANSRRDLTSFSFASSARSAAR